MKYSPEELQSKAAFLIELRERNPAKYLHFCQKVSEKTGASFSEVEQKIQQFATLQTTH